MAMRTQVVETPIFGKDFKNKSRSTLGVKGNISIFINYFGQNMTTMDNEFYTIEKIGLSRGIMSIGEKTPTNNNYDAYVQLRIEKERVFHDVFGDDRLGISGKLIPIEAKQLLDELDWPLNKVYIPADKSWDFIVQCNTPMRPNEFIWFASILTLYDGKDGMTANMLYNNGKTVTDVDVARFIDENREMIDDKWEKYMA